MRSLPGRFIGALLVGASLVALPFAVRSAHAQAPVPQTMGPSSAVTARRTTTAWKDSTRAFRVCSDPDNLPFSDAKRDGFENKIAAVIAAALGDSVSYLWWPTRRGFINNTLNTLQCDVVMGIPSAYDLVRATHSYYRSRYYIVTRADRHLDITTLDDPRLKQLTIGVNIIGEDYTNTPPAMALSAHGVTQHLVGYSTFYNDEHRPGDIVDGVVKGDIDVALVWGPLAGYYAGRSSVPLTLSPLPDSDSSGLPFAFDVAIGVRHSDRELAAKINAILTQKRSEIEQILREYHIPTEPSTRPNSPTSSQKDGRHR
ncbi:MAG TPA: quinoprotein dehydrogenase-associated putative ABC transporter substrate-binding protein [Gemmatimonadaceae bacterium]|nr:quinoprotein dehydrogenase-associated putative ABC transporter substrate-binding protein [Gemmatimonadaceae bacterium]